MKRTAEFVLGLIGGILGIISSVAIMALGELFALFSVEAGALTTGFGIIALILSVIAIVGGIIIRKKAKLGKILLLVAGVVLLIFSFLPFLGLSFIVPAILSLIGGILGFVRKERPSVAA